MAQSVYAAFGDYGAAGGLTRNQIASACAKSIPREVFESRFDLLVSMGFPYRYADKAHQMHYAINPDGVTGLLVFGRATKAGGIEEIMLLLGIRARHSRREPSPPSSSRQSSTEPGMGWRSTRVISST